MRTWRILLLALGLAAMVLACDDDPNSTPDLQAPEDWYDQSSVDGIAGDGSEGVTYYGPDTNDTAPDTPVDLCQNVSCEEWETCQAGVCELDSGRCDSNDSCANGEVCDLSIHECIADPCASVDCGNGGICSTQPGGEAICNCPDGFMADGLSCVADTAPSVHWCNIQWPATIDGAVGDPAETVYGQIYVESLTPFTAVPDGFISQLGITSGSPSYPIIQTDFRWVDASHNAGCTTCGNNNEFMADFPKDQGGTLQYLYRFSLNDGASWAYCDTNGKVVSATMTPGVATLTGGGGDCGGVFCESWEQCASDQCEPQPGRCNQASDCPSDQTCDIPTHNCVALGDGPTLILMGQPIISADGYQLEVQYSGANPLDFDASTIWLNMEDVDLTSSYDESTGVFSISASGLSQGKYTYLFRVMDDTGESARPLYIPMWIEDTPFEWKDMFLYQIMTDRFLDGDSNNNAPVPGVDFDKNWQGGDFAGIIQKIEDGYFDEMGANVLWISSPILNTDGWGVGINDPAHYSGYHSYWPIATGWTHDNHLPGIDSPIETHFGTEEELKTLIRVAHENNIRVLADMVANHVYGITNSNNASGTTAPVWDQHRNDNWFHDANSPYICGWEQPIICWFTDYLPDFNYSNPDVLNYVVDHAIWMVQEYDLDGFRLDAVKHMVMPFTTTMRARIAQDIETTGVEFYTVGETFDGDKGKLSEYVGPDKLTGQFEFGFYFAIKGNLLEGTNLGEIKNMCDDRDTYYQNSVWNDALMPYFIGNHDVSRAFTIAGNDYGKLRAALTILMTSPPPPLIYQGDEIGEPGGADPDNRHMMRFDVTGEEATTRDHVRKLGLFRAQHEALRGGTRSTCNSGGAVGSDFWIYKMVQNGDVVLVGINRSSSEVSADCGESGTFVDAFSGSTESISGNLSVPAWSTVVLGKE